MSQIMGTIAIIGVSLGFLKQAPGLLVHFLMQLVLPVAIIAAICYAIYFVSRLKPRYRLPIAIATLITLLSFSTHIWWPGFYSYEEQRCLELARKAISASASSQGCRKALDREAAWFTRRASDLYWRGLWLGLTMGLMTRNHAAMARRSSLTYELGTLESMEKHEKKVEQLIAAGSCPDE